LKRITNTVFSRALGQVFKGSVKDYRDKRDRKILYNRGNRLIYIDASHDAGRGLLYSRGWGINFSVGIRIIVWQID
jgi:hypothetical protein